MLIAIASIILAIPINSWIFQQLVHPNTAEIIFENKSNLIADVIDVRLCETNQQIKSIDPGKSASVIFNVSGDCHYTISVSFNSGTSLNTETGYVTSGSNFKDTIVIEDNRLVESDHTIEPDPNSIIKTIGLFLSYFIIILILYRCLFFIFKKVRPAG